MRKLVKMRSVVYKYVTGVIACKLKATGKVTGCFRPHINLIALIVAGLCISFKPGNDIEKVDLYLGHFLLQSWPGGKCNINIDINPDLAPDTLTFKASGFKTGLTQTTLDIQNTQGTTVEQIHRQNPKADATIATFIYVLNKEHLDKIRGNKFKVVLDNHQYTTPEIHQVATINIITPQ
jgi:hypothetical protein